MEEEKKATTTHRIVIRHNNLCTLILPHGLGSPT
jgi:hypothetical protein